MTTDMWVWPSSPVATYDAPLPADPPVSGEQRRHDELMAAIDGLREALRSLPAPEVIVEPAAPGQVPPPDPERLSAAIRDALAPVVRDSATVTAGALESVTERLKVLSKQIVASTAVAGGGNSLPDNADRLLGHVSIDTAGTFGYTAGTSGTVALTSGEKVATITAHCTTAGSLTINGGPAVVIPANSQFSATYLDGKLTNPTLVFTGTDSYYVDFLS